MAGIGITTGEVDFCAVDNETLGNHSPDAFCASRDEDDFALDGACKRVLRMSVKLEVEVMYLDVEEIVYVHFERPLIQITNMMTELEELQIRITTGFYSSQRIEIFNHSKLRDNIPIWTVVRSKMSLGTPQIYLDPLSNVSQEGRKGHVTLHYL